MLLRHELILPRCCMKSSNFEVFGDFFGDFLGTFWRLDRFKWASLAQRGSFGGCTFGTDPEARWLQVAAGGCRWLQVAVGC